MEETSQKVDAGQHKEASADKVAVMVLGMHRSGTSVLSGILNQLGCDLPKSLMPPSKDNPTGYFESSKLMAFNDQLLNSLGSDWKDIGPLNLVISSSPVFESFLAEAVALVRSEFSGARLPLLKDPRICRLTAFWEEVLGQAGYRVAYIHTHRNPIEVGASLHKRDGIPLECGMLVWLRHVLDAELATRDSVRFFVSYDDLLEDWRPPISAAEKVLGFSFHRQSLKVERQIDGFISAELRNHSACADDLRRSPQVSGWVRETFQILESWKGSAGKDADFARLDTIRRNFDASVEQINAFIGAIETLKEGLAQTSAKIEEKSRAIIAEREATIEALKEALAQTSAKLEEESRAIIAERESLNEELTSIQQAIGERDQKIRSLEQSVEQRFSEIADVSALLMETQRKESQARRRLEGTLSSTSWRMTAPLRKTLDFVRR